MFNLISYDTDAAKNLISSASIINREMVLYGGEMHYTVFEF